jgi:serine protease SohB
MKTFLIVAIIIVALVAILIFLKIRRKRRSVIRVLSKHANGFSKYHSDTQIKVKKSLSKSNSENTKKTSVAVFDFHGDLKASLRHSLSRCIDEILLNKDLISECVIKVESPGGSVMDYGHAYSEICRLREAGVNLTVCVDTVAASGGYLMSLPAQKIMAAPFAMVGSIGVVSFIPNFRKLLERMNIEPRTFSAGDYKRTVTLTDNATPEQVKHYEEQLKLIHDQFKQALKRYRTQVELNKVATGEAWLASTTQDLNLGLIDELRLSSDYLLEKNKNFDIVEFSEKKKKQGFKSWFKFLRNEILTLFSEASMF